MARFAWVYQDKRFKVARLLVIQRDQGLCQRCLKRGIKRKGTIVHHIIWISNTNCNDLYILFDIGNMELLCEACHNEVHNRSNGLTAFVDPP